jgi:hypothetical protein
VIVTDNLDPDFRFDEFGDGEVVGRFLNAHDPEIGNKFTINSSTVNTNQIGTYTVTYRATDHAGNATTVTRTVIVSVPPTGTITYSTTNSTNQAVTATITVPIGVGIINNDGKNYFVFEENGSFDFELENEYGMTATVTATVDWIDRVAPNGEVEFDIETPTNQNVTATI